jgi:aconitase A
MASKSLSNLSVGSKKYDVFPLKGLNADKLPFTLKILLENLLR